MAPRRRGRYAGWPVVGRNALALAVIVLALWVLLNSVGKLGDTWDVVFAVVAGVLALISSDW